MGTLNLKLGIVLLLGMLLFSSCSIIPQGESADSTSSILSQVQSGTRGIEIDFVSSYPPATLYDVGDMVMLLEVENKGAYDVGGADCYLQVTGFDSNIIRGIDYVQSCGPVDGKNVYNLDGGWNQVEYSSSSITLPDDTLEYSPNLNLVWCYEYQTIANPSICVDPLFYQITSEQKACSPQDVGMGGGQGGPVSVTYTGVDMIGDTAVFEISVQNSGGGRVLSPYADISNCGESVLDYEDLDRVGYTIEMTGGSMIECTPSNGLLRLSNDVGKIVCSFRINGQSAYETPLQITLDYNYIESTQQGIQIISTP
ncbi:hypothetical protein HOA92_01895 [archaeon]|jgi:hypothetical protein|nr:hypothetical protein [archaeon]MBT6761766.1 hypothetical protein [archaeon]